MQATDYLVVSPEMTFYGHGYEPDEDGACVVQVQALNARDAIAQAMRTKEFEPWLRERRFDGKNPFTGVQAQRLDTLGDEW